MQVSVRHAALALLGLSCATAACSAGGAGADVIASVEGEGLTVEAAAQLFAPYSSFSNNPESIRSVAELWIDLVLIAGGIEDDPMLSGVDVSSVTELEARAPLIRGLRDQVIDVDTALTEEEVRESYREENPGTRVRARHILVQVPPDIPAADRDSLYAVTERIRERIVRGESFEEVASQYSDDPGSAEQGGDLGFFERGQMVAPFEESAFALQPGELSEIVQTQFGYHIIRVDEREDPTFEEIRAEVRARDQQRIRSRAESIYITGLEETAGLEVADGATEATRAVAENPTAQPDDRNRPLVSYDGGSLTIGDLRDYLLMQEHSLVQQVRSVTPQQIETLLRNLARQELMVREAERLGVEPVDVEMVPTAEQIQQQAVVTARTLGVARHLEEVEGATPASAADSTVAAMLRGDTQVPSFGPTVGAMRLTHDVRMYPDRFGRVVARVQEIRSAPDFRPYLRETPEDGAGSAPSDAPDSLPSPEGAGDQGADTDEPADP